MKSTVLPATKAGALSAAQQPAGAPARVALQVPVLGPAARSPLPHDLPSPDSLASSRQWQPTAQEAPQSRTCVPCSQTRGCCLLETSQLNTGPAPLRPGVASEGWEAEGGLLTAYPSPITGAHTPSAAPAINVCASGWSTPGETNREQQQVEQRPGRQGAHGKRCTLHTPPWHGQSPRGSPLSADPTDKRH